MAMSEMDKRESAIHLRLRGENFDTIARILGMSEPAARAYVEACLAGLRESAPLDRAALVQLEEDRLNSLQAACWDEARHGNLQAIAVSLRIMERRAALLGLDADRPCCRCAAPPSPER